MEDNLAFESNVQTNPLYLTDSKFKLLKAEEVETAVGLGPDKFPVDDLLNFSNEDIGGPISGSYISDESVESAITGADVVGQHSSTKPITLSHQFFNQEQEEKDLRLDDDFAELDWLTNFAEDSGCGNDNAVFDYSQDLLLNLDMESYHETNAGANQFQMTSPVSVLENSASSGSGNGLSWETSLPGRPRSKRSRSGSKMWSSGVISSSSQDRNEYESYANSLLSFECSDLSVDSVPRFTMPRAELLPVKKSAKPWRGRKLAQEGSEIRKCAHCMTQRTPQWRAGPDGPKTLCNACGVRYKSGRLLPEYRPALSPTFQSHAHSNSHRKVLEMRRLKEMGLMQQQLLHSA